MAAFLEDEFVEKGDKYDLYFDPAAIQKPTPVHVKPKPGRNDPCNCGSGRKYKKCCGGANGRSTT